MKILIISHNCLSTYNNMGKTFLSLFSSFKKEELCQLYIYPMLPDVDVCHSYYRVTDKEVLKSLFTLQNPGGPLDLNKLSFGISREFEHPEDAAVYGRSANRTSVARLLRDTMWKLSRWYTPELRKWIQTEKPSCIFLAPGYAKFIYDIALRINQDYHIPIVTYICDDYYFVDPQKSMIGRLQLALLHRKMDQLMRKTVHIVGISEELCQRYGIFFGVETSLIMTGAQGTVAASEYSGTGVFSFIGNLRPQRQHSLVQLGQAIYTLNRRMGTQACLRVYTSETDSELLKPLKKCPTIKLMGFVTGEAMAEALRTTDFLVHVESFEPHCEDLVKYSVSTKIADILASGIPLVAYGPERIASIQHLHRNHCAFIATSEQQLIPVLQKALTCSEARTEVVQNGRKAVLQFHDASKNSQLLYNILRDNQKEGMS